MLGYVHEQSEQNCHEAKKSPAMVSAQLYAFFTSIIGTSAGGYKHLDAALLQIARVIAAALSQRASTSAMLVEQMMAARQDKTAAEIVDGLRSRRDMLVVSYNGSDEDATEAFERIVAGKSAVINGGLLENFKAISADESTNLAVLEALAGYIIRSSNGKSGAALNAKVQTALQDPAIQQQVRAFTVTCRERGKSATDVDAAERPVIDGVTDRLNARVISENMACIMHYIVIKKGASGDTYCVMAAGSYGTARSHDSDFGKTAFGIPNFIVDVGFEAAIETEGWEWGTNVGGESFVFKIAVAGIDDPASYGTVVRTPIDDDEPASAGGGGRTVAAAISAGSLPSLWGI